MGNQEFFTARKAAAVLKHGILARYLPAFVAKTGSTSVGGRVVVLDGYAGEGRYEDGSPGSPVFMAETARNLQGKRHPELYFVEQDKRRSERLTEVLVDEATGVDWHVLHGSVEEHLDQVLIAAKGVPFFAFLDPYGVGLGFDHIVERIFSRPGGQYEPATEVIINFSADAIRRIGGRLKEPAGSPGREATLARLDTACGGDWWRKDFLKAASSEEASARIARKYFKKLTKAAKAAGWIVAVRNAPHHQPKYSLVFLTRHRDGLWLFGESTSLAQADWRKALVDPNSLFGEEQFLLTSEAELEDEWVAEIRQNIELILVDASSFWIRDKVSEVMGEALGQAREKHLRRALNELLTAGTISSKPTGKLNLHKVVRF